jgi:hypothetical protein
VGRREKEGKGQIRRTKIFCSLLHNEEEEKPQKCFYQVFRSFLCGVRNASQKAVLSVKQEFEFVVL